MELGKEVVDETTNDAVSIGNTPHRGTVPTVAVASSTWIILSPAVTYQRQTGMPQACYASSAVAKMFTPEQ